MSTDISVLWISKATMRDGMYNLVHTHDYFHFSCTMRKENGVDAVAQYISKPLFCAAPDTPHGGIKFPPGDQSINIMFLVHDKTLYKMIETFPFDLVEKDRARVEVLQNIVEMCRMQTADPELINVAFNYYIRLVMQDNHDLLLSKSLVSLPDRCIAYINEHYMEQITLEAVATYIGKSRNYTSTVFNNAVGMNLMEYLNSVRMKKACEMMAYSDMSVEDIANMCGFSNIKYFGRVFKSVVGTSPMKYRTSHAVKDCRFDGDYVLLKAPYSENDDTFTYTVSAQKFVKWKSPYEYITQKPEDRN